ncbi:MAG: LuxR C-terminal-related transcriptional regulator [Spirochaetia bacterium]|nr:LuxR C-terminal-related transcriptional regulator [Spirochaetia bacterium]
MPEQILTTKIYIPLPGSKVIARQRLIDKLNAGVEGKLSLVCAHAGYGKTTLVARWLAKIKKPAAMLSLDHQDNEPVRFLTYFISALQIISKNIGKSVLASLQTPQPPSIDSILTSLVNDISSYKNKIIFVIDDYHVIDSKPIDDILTFLLENQPPNMHIVIATREDPMLPLAKLRAKGQLSEIRADKLCFTEDEASDFFNEVMGLNISKKDIHTLEERTEGWIAGLQLAALSIQNYKDKENFIKSFSGSHQFILDYLVEEVLNRQTEEIQNFLLYTSILERLSGSLCDAVLSDKLGKGQENLEFLQNANLFLIPLDNERKWFRYHHLFRDFLRKHLQKKFTVKKSEKFNIIELHLRASKWYEENHYETDAFCHATEANDIERAVRLIKGKGMPLYVRGAFIPVIDWFKSLSKEELDKNPELWLMYASALLAAGHTSSIEEKLISAEKALEKHEMNEEVKNLLGSVASCRATIGFSKYQHDIVIKEAKKALEYLHPQNLLHRATAHFQLGMGYMQKEERALASKSFSEAILISEKIGAHFMNACAAIGLGEMQFYQSDLFTATETQKKALRLLDDMTVPVACEAHRTLAQIFYQWNDLDKAHYHADKWMEFALLYDKVLDRYIMCEIFLARLNLALKDTIKASAIIKKTIVSINQNNFAYRQNEATEVQSLIFLRQDKLKAVRELVKTHNLPFIEVRLFLAEKNTASALTLLDKLTKKFDKNFWQKERLEVLVLEALSHWMNNSKDKALKAIGEALALAEPGKFVRIFIDEGKVMEDILLEAHKNGTMVNYTEKLLKEFKAEKLKNKSIDLAEGKEQKEQPLIDPLSQRELEILKLIADGLSNRKISEQLFLELSTIKSHNQNIFGKLGVERRTEAVARARELGLI